MGVKSRSGQGLLEYAFLLLLIAFAVLAILKAVGQTLNTEWYQRISSALTDAWK